MHYEYDQIFFVPLLQILQAKMFGYNYLKYFRSTFTNLEDALIAVEPFYGIVLKKTVSAKNLHRLICNFLSNFRTI